MLIVTIDELLYYHNDLSDASSMILLDAARRWDDDLIPAIDYFNLRDALLGFGSLDGDGRGLPFDYLTNNGITYKIEVA